MTPFILLVDDEINVLRALRRTLRSESLRIIYENDPHSALKRIEEQSFAIIISDFRMPSINGVELLEYCKYRQPCATRIILSAYADREILMEAINTAEIYRFLAKPWDDMELTEVLKGAMHRHRQQQESMGLLELVRNAHDPSRLEGALPAIAEASRDCSKTVESADAMTLLKRSEAL